LSHRWNDPGGNLVPTVAMNACLSFRALDVVDKHHTFHNFLLAFGRNVN
jgi:hypothetical protein